MFGFFFRKKSRSGLERRKAGNAAACCFRTDRIMAAEPSAAGRPDYKDFLKLPAAIAHIIPQSAANTQQLSRGRECVCPRGRRVSLMRRNRWPSVTRRQEFGFKTQRKMSGGLSYLFRIRHRELI